MPGCGLKGGRKRNNVSDLKAQLEARAKFGHMAKMQALKEAQRSEAAEAGRLHTEQHGPLSGGMPIVMQRMLCNQAKEKEDAAGIEKHCAVFSGFDHTDMYNPAGGKKSRKARKASKKSRKSAKKSRKASKKSAKRGRKAAKKSRKSRKSRK